MADRLKLHSSGRTEASPAQLWPLVEDVTRYTEWGMWQETGYREPGDPPPHGVGALRWLRYGRTTTVERMVEVVDGQRSSYRVVSGLPVKDYLATVELTPDGTGTKVDWSAAYAPTILGRLIHRKMTSVYERCVRDLCAAGDRLAATAGPS
jgi:hypothetical protein